VNPAVLQTDAALDDALTRLIDEEKTGITLCAPPSVAAGARALRIAGCRVETLREAARRPSFESMALIIAAQLETGRVRAARAFPHSGDMANMRMPASDPGEGCTGSVFRLDVAARLGIPLVPGPIALWMIARERGAGPERIVVESPALQGVEDPEVAKFIAAWQRRTTVKPRGADPRMVWPPETVFGKYPTYRQGPESPPLPAQGIVIRENQGILSGSFRLKIPRRHVVLEPLSGDPTTALVPITLVASDNEIPGPIVRHLRVPSFSPIGLNNAAPVVEGRFYLNLLSFSVRWQPSHTYFIYAVSGDTLSNLVTMRVVQGT